MNPTPLPGRPALADHARLRNDPKSGEPVLLYPEGYLALNDGAHAIAQLCDGTRSVDELVSALAEEFEADANQLRDDVVDFLTELRRRNLLLP